MKYQFQKEDHNRQDKAKKSDYLEDLRERAPAVGTWSGANAMSWTGIQMKNLQQKGEIRQLELRRATAFYFVYGKWLYQNTKKLSHFVQLNAAHTTSSDPELEPAFQKCRKNWESDCAKILGAIKSAPIVRPKGLPRWFPGGEVVAWELPSDIVADEVWRKMPPAFKAPKKTQSTPTPTESPEQP